MNKQQKKRICLKKKFRLKVRILKKKKKYDLDPDPDFNPDNFFWSGPK